MLDKIFTFCFLRIWLLLFLLPLGLSAQIRITTPVERAIYQRNNTGQATVSVTGNYTVPVDKIEIRALPAIDGQGLPTAWAPLQTNPTGGLFSGTITLFQGWYTLEVRGSLNGAIVGQTSVVSRMGVGEVFVIAGQSNAQGVDYEFPNKPVATDDRVNYINYNNSVNSLNDPPYPIFERMNAVNITVGPRGKTPWCWGILGDLLTQKLNVPVLFINAAWEGTSIGNWSESAQGRRTQNSFGFFYPDQMPYANLRLSMQHYAKEFGVRSILWMQGETDTYPLATDYETYRSRLQFVLDKLGSDINGRVTWVISRTSRIQNANLQSVTSPAVIGAQNAVIDGLFSSAYPGPETDPLYPQRFDGTHFSGTTGLTILANAWNNTLNTAFFSNVSPLLPAAVPKITSICAPNNTSLTLTLPEGYASYTWLPSGATSRTITVTSPGEYSARVKDASGNTVHSQKLIVTSSIKPETPTIVQSGSQQACADSAFVFSLTSSNDAYSWFKQGTTNVLATTPTFAVEEAGTYQVRSQNVFGCTSDVSAAASLLIRPEVPEPTVAKSGPFTIMASIPEGTMNEQYDWKRDERILALHSNIIKTDTSGQYSARTKVNYTLGNNLLTCYSSFSGTQEVITDTQNDVVIFPNPGAADDLYIESRDNMRNAEITVYDMFGRVVITQTQDLTSRVKILTKNLPSGKYVIRIKSADVDLTKQVIVR
ncbi:T9SS type A sorting domain-containing protein [Dyadobacter sp. CY345]|uniref:T9SS type A sorting domain-containing protein n=1 Tax=Dyadobacter sp. CY345 TaxID=2909335 RepID=UPI001F3F4EBC|nr:T9SS type A sorting domain-containing protein [Dyadobacter sp. CY345]MCF2445998.1 T9SS type A sorting domain-containing protein [Dyadobacter sp. CY345]